MPSVLLIMPLSRFIFLVPQFYAGKRPDACARLVRTGCLAIIRLLRGDDDTWYISRFNNEHNHPLLASNNECRQWNSHNRIDPMTKYLVRNLRENNVQISCVCSIVGAVHGAGGQVSSVGNLYVHYVVG